MLIINDSQEVQEPMPEHEYTKEEVLRLYAQLLRARAALPTNMRHYVVLEYGQLITALRHTYHVCDLELLNAEVCS